jgi:hypothetical protein
LEEFLSKEGDHVYEEWKKTHEETHIQLSEIIDFMEKRLMIKNNVRKFVINIKERMIKEKEGFVIMLNMRVDQKLKL